MPARHFTVPGDDLLTLTAKRADRRVWPEDVEDQHETLMALLDAVDKIFTELDTCQARWVKALIDAGKAPRRCESCGCWFDSYTDGRRRLHCVACRPARRVRPVRSGLDLNPADADSGLTAVS